MNSTRTGSEQNYGLTLSGGGDASTYFISGNYNKVDGVAIGNEIQRYTFRINTDHQIGKKLKFKQGLYFKNGIEDPTVSGGTGQIYRRSPLMVVYDPSAVSNRDMGRVMYGFQGNNDVQRALSSYERAKDLFT